MDNVFEEFFQIVNAESDRSKGHGLGLSIVKRTAQLLDHGLSLRSELGRGSTFTISLPFSAEVARKAPIDGALQPNDALKNTFVVVIDDDEQNLFAMRTLCAQWGCHVVAANSAEAALTELENHLRVPDLIISDYRLREQLTGFSAVSQIREQAETVMPAIIVTGDMVGGNPDFETLPIAQVTIMQKPVNPVALKAEALRLLAGKMAEDARI